MMIFRYDDGLYCMINDETYAQDLALRYPNVIVFWADLAPVEV